MPVKVTYLYNLVGQGWSSTFYNNSISTLPTGQNPQMPPQVSALGNAIFGTLAPGVNFIGTRISLVPPTRQTFVQAANYVRTGAADQIPDYPTTAMMLIAKGNQGLGTRQVWLHGINDNEINYANGVFTPAGGLLTAAGNVCTQLVGNGWALRTVAPKAGNGFPINVIAVGANFPGLSISVGGAWAFPASGAVIVSGFKYPLQKLNGTYLVGSGLVQQAGTTYLANRFISAAAAALYVPGSANIRYQIPNYTPIAQCAFEFVRERRVGRAFFVPRGRRSSK
jgi:hypothetical protein